LLRESGPVPGDENGLKTKRPAGGEESAKKKKRTDKNVSCPLSSHNLETPANTSKVDMDRLADGLQKLNEDDLLQVVQMVHDNKAPDSYTKNDVERKYFSRGLGLDRKPPSFPSMAAISTLTYTQWENSTSTCTPCPTH
jgi:transcription initiation factor IIF auxiliary subunit